MLDALKAMNLERHRSMQDPEILTRIAQYEMAFRMQTSVPELVDIQASQHQSWIFMAQR